MVSKYGHLMLPGSFPNKATSNIDFSGDAVVQCYIKKKFVGAGNIQMIRN